MNQRIKELAEQSASTFGGTFTFNGGNVSMVDLEKFAELIVRECIEINKQELSFSAFERLMNKYKDHFGVEE